MFLKKPFMFLSASEANILSSTYIERKVERKIAEAVDAGEFYVIISNLCISQELLYRLNNLGYEVETCELSQGSFGPVLIIRWDTE